jgi:hypothetical protein
MVSCTQANRASGNRLGAPHKFRLRASSFAVVPPLIRITLQLAGSTEPIARVRTWAPIGTLLVSSQCAHVVDRLMECWVSG